MKHENPYAGLAGSPAPAEFEDPSDAVEERGPRDETGFGTLAEAAEMFRPSPPCPRCGASPARRDGRGPSGVRRRRRPASPPPLASGRRSGATSRKGAALVHDRERAHSVPVGENGLADEPCKADARDPEHPEATEPANNLRSRPKRYLRRFAGMDPENLQSYPNPYVYFFRVERDDERRPKIARAVRHLLMAEARFRR